MFSFLLFSFSIVRRWTQCGQLMCDFYASCTECLSQQYTYSICWKFAYANKQLNTTTAECFCFRHFPHTRMSLTPQRKGNKNDSKSACIIQNWTNCISSIQRQKALISFYFITRFLGEYALPRIVQYGVAVTPSYCYNLHFIHGLLDLCALSCTFLVHSAYRTKWFLTSLVYFWMFWCISRVYFMIYACAPFSLNLSLSLSSLCPTTISAPIARDGNSGNHITESKCETSWSEMRRLRFSCFWSLCFCVWAPGSGLYGKIRSSIVQ